MNAERLHKILFDVQNEINKIDLVGDLQELMNEMQNMVDAPEEASYQQNVSTTLNQLYENLKDVPSNSFSPAWKQTLDEIGLSSYLGLNLKQKLESIFSHNQITPSSALEEITAISESLNEFNSSISDIVAGFIVLHIGREELEPGECEVGYLIPRKFTESKLSILSKEVSELNFILSNISEIINGEKEEYFVRTISSSDYLFYIGVSLTVANILSIVTDRIVNIYKNILEIKELRNRLKEIGVPAKDTMDIESFANKQMEEEIKRISLEIINNFCKGKELGRKNELSNGLTISLNKIANRIDQGFNLEVRVEPLRNTTEEVTSDDNEKIQLIDSIQNLSKSMEFINTTGQPILKLSETLSK